MNEDHPLHMLDNQVDPEKKPLVILQKPIRTYESDVADALARNKPSIVTMAIAENRQKAEGAAVISNKEPSQAGKKVLIIVISLVLVVVGLGGLYYLYLQSPLAPQARLPQQTQIPSIVTPDSQKLLSLDGASKEQVVSLIQNAFNQSAGEVGKIYEIIPTKISASTTVRFTAGNLVEVMDFQMPDTLKRSLTNQWMLGVYAGESQKAPFILFTTDFFQNAFAGMLSWENSMAEEMADILGYRAKAETNRESTGNPIASYFGLKGSFEDRIVRNRDVREFRDETGELLLLYAFLDKDTLVITTSENTLGALIDRIDKQTYIR